MKINDAFASDYLKASDLQGRGNVTLTMDHAKIIKIGGDEKPALFFQETTKGLVLNKTNANTIAGLYGNETADWKGQPIQLYQTMVEFQGNMVQAIRVRAAVAPPAQPETANELPPGIDPDDDDLPF